MKDEAFGRGCDSRLHGIGNGNMKIMVEVTAEIPAFVRIGIWRIRIGHRDQIIKCFMCGSKEHLKKSCNLSVLDGVSNTDASSGAIMTEGVEGVEEDVEGTGSDEVNQTIKAPHFAPKGRTSPSSLGVHHENENSNETEDEEPICNDLSQNLDDGPMRCPNSTLATCTDVKTKDKHVVENNGLRPPAPNLRKLRSKTPEDKPKEGADNKRLKTITQKK